MIRRGDIDEGMEYIRRARQTVDAPESAPEVGVAA